MFVSSVWPGAWWDQMGCKTSMFHATSAPLGTIPFPCYMHCSLVLVYYCESHNAMQVVDWWLGGEGPHVHFVNGSRCVYKCCTHPIISTPRVV